MCVCKRLSPLFSLFYCQKDSAKDFVMVLNVPPRVPLIFQDNSVTQDDATSETKDAIVSIFFYNRHANIFI